MFPMFLDRTLNRTNFSTKNKLVVVCRMRFFAVAGLIPFAAPSDLGGKARLQHS